MRSNFGAFRNVTIGNLTEVNQYLSPVITDAMHEASTPVFQYQCVLGGRSNIKISVFLKAILQSALDLQAKPKQNITNAGMPRATGWFKVLKEVQQMSKTMDPQAAWSR